MAGNPNFGNLYSTSTDNYLPKLKDNYTSMSRLLDLLKKAGNIRTEDGGVEILENIEFAENGAYNRYDGAQAWNLENKKFATAASYARKKIAVTMVVTGSEIMANSGKSRKIDLIASKIKNGAKTLQNGLAHDVYSDGTDALQIGGLQYLVSDTPNTGVVGGIDACMICNVGWGVNWICEIDQCDKGTWALDDNPYNNPCMVCPANTYQDGCINPGEECTPCPAGTGTIGDTAADHDSIDDCIPIVSCSPGYYLPADSTSCTQCPKNSYCPGGTFTPTTTDSGITQCPDNMYSPLGSDSADDCGRVLHIGEYILYLRTAKLTVPSLNVQIGNAIYYGDMFPA